MFLALLQQTEPAPRQSVGLIAGNTAVMYLSVGFCQMMPVQKSVGGNNIWKCVFCPCLL